MTANSTSTAKTLAPAPPPGINLADNLQGELRIVAVLTTSLAAIFVALRFYIRIKHKIVGRDDYMLLAALLSHFVFFWCFLMVTHYGMGRHLVTLSPYQITNFLKHLLAQGITYLVTCALIKMALLMMYCRIFTYRAIRWAVLPTGIISLGGAMAIIPISIFQCKPIEKIWHPFMPGTCIVLRNVFISLGALNILTDSMTLAIPIPLVWKLRLGLWRRLSLVFVFSLGIFAVCASIYRYSTIFTFDISDSSWSLVRLSSWSLIECAVGIITCCLPTLRPLFICVFGRRATDDDSGPSDVTTVGGGGGGGGVKKRFRNIFSDSTFQDSTLRPPHEDVVLNSIACNRSDRGEGDDVLLTGINVRTDIEWSESAPGAAPSSAPSSVMTKAERNV